MAVSPLRPCATPRCPHLVVKGKCPDCRRQQEQHRGSRIDRGYDAAWLRLRDWFISQPENVLCRQCQAEGRTTLSAEVDHIVPFEGLDDPLRLDPANLQALCVQHHREKTARQSRAV